MTHAIITGHVLNKPIYRRRNDKEMECCFFVHAVEPYTNEMCQISVKAIGAMADYCYANISVGTHVELTGSIYMRGREMYIIVQNVEFKQPKSRTEMLITADEFYRTYSPIPVLKKLVGLQVKKELNKKEK